MSMISGSVDLSEVTQAYSGWQAFLNYFS